MECMKIRENLSGYLDNMLSPEEEALIDSHITSCSACAAALSDLRKTIEHAKNLEEVEPPFWLKQKVMARLRAEAKPKRGFLKGLFSPLPVGAIATITIALTTLYVFRSMQSEIRPIQAPSEVGAPQVFQERKPAESDAGGTETMSTDRKDSATQPPSVLSDKKGEASVGKQEVPSREKDGEDIAARKTRQRMTAQEREAQRQRPEIAPSAPAPVKQPEELRKESASAPATARDSIAPHEGRGTRGETKQEVQAAPRLKALAAAKAETRFIVHVKDPEIARRDITEIVSSLGGKVAGTEQTEKGFVMTVALEEEKVEGLKERLSRLGVVKETVPPLEGLQGKQEIRIEVVAAAP